MEIQIKSSWKQFFLTILILLLVVNLFAQWEPDVRLTFNESSSYTSSDRCIATSGDTIHVVWCDNRDGNFEIYYKRSTDEGTTWESDNRLTYNNASSSSPSIAVSNSNIHVVWNDNRDENYEIYYKRSTNGGINWGVDIRLTIASASSSSPSIAVSNSNIHVVWYDDRDGNFEIYYLQSIDGGSTWRTENRLTEDSGYSVFPSVAVSGSNVHIVWMDLRNGPPDIYYKRSTDGGTTWQIDTDLPGYHSNAWSPSITVAESNIHLVWNDWRYEGIEIYYKRSTDKGTTWENDTRLTDDNTYSVGPSVAVSDSNVHVVWNDDRDSNREIYYKRNPTGNIKLTRDSFLKIFPNPMKKTTLIRYCVTERKYISFNIYDILGRIVTTITAGERPPGIFTTSWNGKDLEGQEVTPGIYFLKADGVNAGKVVKVR